MAEQRILVGDIAVKEATGRDWTEWARFLDQRDAATLTHREIVGIVEDCGVGSWWSQMVAVTYEQMRGIRERHQKRDSTYSATVSKTINAPVEDVFAAWQTPRRRARWLRDDAITVRRATPPKSMRITWSDGTTHVDVGFFAKGKEKSQVAVEHSKLPAKADVDAKKKLWTAALDRLKKQVEK